MKKLNKKQRNKFYKELLNKLIFIENENNTYYRVCCEASFILSNKTISTYQEVYRELDNLIPEFFLFKQNDKFEFFELEEANELRVFALQLCIEMTK